MLVPFCSSPSLSTAIGLVYERGSTLQDYNRNSEKMAQDEFKKLNKKRAERGQALLPTHLFQFCLASFITFFVPCVVYKQRHFFNKKKNYLFTLHTAIPMLRQKGHNTKQFFFFKK